MGRIDYEKLPEIDIYTIGPDEADRAAALLTPEAVEMIKEGNAFGLCAVEEGEARGAVSAGFLSEDDMVLDIISLYVAPEHRRKGLGITLLMELIERAMDAADGMIRAINADFSAMDEEGKLLFEKAGFSVETAPGVVSWKAPLSALAGSPLLKEHSGARVPETVLLALDEVTDLRLQQLYQVLRENDADYLTVPEMRKADPEVSYLLYDKNSQPLACVFFSAVSEDRVAMSLFFTQNTAPAAGLMVLAKAAERLCALYPPETVLEIPTLTDSGARLVKKLLGDGLETEELCRAVYEFT